MSRGDFVSVIVDAGAGTVKEFDVEATKKGRRVEVTEKRLTTEVAEIDQGGNTVRTCRFRNDRIVALIEHKVEDAPKPAAQT
jgi:hypothetical protein